MLRRQVKKLGLSIKERERRMIRKSFYFAMDSI